MTKEQVENIKDAIEEGGAGVEGRERSTIQFPYNDLDDVVSLVKVIHDNAGLECTVDQLAGYVKSPKTSGAFRLRMSSASTYGLTDNERGEVRLTPVGRRIVDPAQEAAARVEAFLQVPLYARVFENYAGFTLPGPAALEKYIRDVGVAPKVTDRARQVFMRSAKQAGFFAHGEDRLVRPAVQGGPGTKPIESDAAKPEPEHKGNGGGSGGGGRLHPFIQGLLDTIPSIPDPKEKPEWPVSERVKWLQTAANIFDLIYKGDGGISVNYARADRSPRHDHE